MRLRARLEIMTCWLLTAAALFLPAVAQTGGANAATGTVLPGAPPPAEPAGVTADPFPQPDRKNFTAASPTVATVDAFLKAIWGYDVHRAWRVEAIQETPAPGLSRVTVFVADKAAGSKVQPSAFFVTPDGKHAIAGDSVITFGEKPFAEARQELMARANGPFRGASGKDLMLVEFADMQCPHCKEAQTTMEQLAKDFPGARIVYQNFPLVAIHPFAYQAAAYGACVAERSNEAFFTYLQAVYDGQDGLTAESGEATLRNAVTKAGLDPAAIATCSETKAARDKVDASIRLGQDVGVDQTPLLAVNGHLLPVNQIPYETLKTIIAYQAAQDGVSAAAAPSGSK